MHGDATGTRGARHPRAPLPGLRSPHHEPASAGAMRTPVVARSPAPAAAHAPGRAMARTSVPTTDSSTSTGSTRRYPNGLMPPVM